MARKGLAKLGKSTTTRGTPRQRAQKGLAQDLRYKVLQDLPPERLEELFERRLKKISADRRRLLDVELQRLYSEDRGEFIVKLLS